jgi:hypothetical protein
LLQRSLFTGCCSGSAGRHFGHLVALIVRQSAENWHPFYQCFPLNSGPEEACIKAKNVRQPAEIPTSPNEASEYSGKNFIY